MGYIPNLFQSIDFTLSAISSLISSRLAAIPLISTINPSYNKNSNTDINRGPLNMNDKNNFILNEMNEYVK